MWLLLKKKDHPDVNIIPWLLINSDRYNDDDDVDDMMMMTVMTMTMIIMMMTMMMMTLMISMTIEWCAAHARGVRTDQLTISK